MKKILLIGYMKKNLGDDLFLSLIINRYKKYNIDIYCLKKFTGPFLRAKNVRFINEEFFKNNSINLDEYDMCIYVGGSIFKETKYDFDIKKWLYEFELDCKKRDIPFYYISSNFGPYQTEEYFDLVKNIIKNCKKMYFRERYSTNLFKLKNAIYNPDLVFSMNYKKRKEIKNTVGVSLINLYAINRGKIDNYYFEYMKFLRNNIINYIKKGKTIYLYSFCEYEGDHTAIKTLKSFIDSKYWKQIKEVYYEGDINRFLNIYSRMEYMLCTRFHSMILSTFFNQKLIVCNYSNKISNVIKDYNLKCDYIQIDQHIEEKNISLSEYKRCNLNDLKEKAKLSYKEIDEFLENKYHLKIYDDAVIGGTYKKQKKYTIRSFAGKVLRKLRIIKRKKTNKALRDIDKSNNYVLDKNLGLGVIDKNIYNECKRVLGYTHEEVKVKKCPNGPLVSVILPTYKRNDFCIQAIESLLNQSYKNIEIIIVDDYVDSDFKKVIDKKYKNNKNVIYTKNKINLKAGRSRQNGYNISKGKYVIFLDDDDFYVDYTFLEDAVNKFESDDEISVVGFNSFVYYEDNNELTFKNIGYSGLCNNLDYIVSFQIEYYKPNPSFAVFRKSILEENNFKDMQMMNDSSIFLKSMKKGKTYLFNKPIGFYRQHSANITLNLTPEFIIDNMKEKKQVYEYLKSNNSIANPDYWWYLQNRLTMSYYIKGSKPSYKNFKKMLKWSMSNMKSYKCRYFKEMLKLQINTKRKARRKHEK